MDGIDANVEHGKEVVFEVVEDSMVTRAPQMSAGDLTKYAVYGITTAGGKLATNSVYTQRNGSWVGSQTIYWPTGTTKSNFYAINGSFAEIATSVSFSKTTQRFVYTTPLNIDEQLDLMVASSLNKTESSNNGKVILKFKHPMCFMNLMAYNAMGDDYKVTFGRIAIHNVDVSARLTFSKTEESVVSVAMQKKYNTLFLDMTENPYELPTSSRSIKSGDYVILYMQRLAKWTTKEGAPVSIAEADAAHQCYVEIDCKIQDEGSNYIYGSDTEWGKVYLPFTGAISWTKQNTTKNATIKFAGGYDENGVPLSFGSGFEIVAEDWESGNENNEPIEVEF